MRHGTPLAVVYTSDEEISNVFGYENLNEHLDQIQSIPEYLTELTERATAVVNQYLLGKYLDLDLASSIRIREIATYIALYKLSIRTGQPELYLYEYQAAIDDLQGFKTGELYLNLPVQYGAGVAMQNSVIDNRFPMRPAAIVFQTSINTRPGQRTAYLPYFGWW